LVAQEEHVDVNFIRNNNFNNNAYRNNAMVSMVVLCVTRISRYTRLLVHVLAASSPVALKRPSIV
jgi:hypothetical protein